jgi:hypothetical protein
VCLVAVTPFDNSCFVVLVARVAIAHRNLSAC